jgi:hypothetical protein
MYSSTKNESKNKSQKFSSVTVQPNSEIQQKSQQQQPHHSQLQYHKIQGIIVEKELPQKYWKPILNPETHSHEKVEPRDDYLSEYYDEIEETATIPLTSLRPAVRVIKRPFLPSRGGNINPRGLLPVGSKAQVSIREENPLKHNIKLHTTTVSSFNDQDEKNNKKQTYNNYKNAQQSEVTQKQQNQQITDNYELSGSKSAIHVPDINIPKTQTEIQSSSIPHKTISSWTTDYKTKEQNNEANTQENKQQARNNIRIAENDNSNIYSSFYKNDDLQEQLSLNGNFKVKQKINEVTHHNLQDIPENEYDVTLNEALTPNISQEQSIPSGFVLPLHRQFGRDAILQSSENTYKFSIPLNHQHQQQKHLLQHTQLQHQMEQQTTFEPSALLVKSSESVKNIDRDQAAYFRIPDTIQINESQYREQKTHWDDYTGF